MRYRSSVWAPNRRSIIFSALNALTTRSPPMVSSTLESMSPHLFCAFIDFSLSFFPTDPIMNPNRGSITNTKRVSCQLITSIIPRQATIMIGYLMMEKRLAITEVCTSCTSPDMRAMMSPLRSLVKNPMGRVTILSYISRRMSRITPFCIGMVKNSDRYPADTLSRVITTSVTQSMARVNDAPSARTISDTYQ